MWVRSGMLIRTALRTIRERGLTAFVRQVVCWLNGERGYSRTFSLQESAAARSKRELKDYKRYQRRTDLPSKELKLQAELLRANPDAPQFDILTIMSAAADWQATLTSLEKQSYPHWVWHIAGLSAMPNTPGLPAHPKIIYTQSDNGVFDHLTGDYVAILNAGDRLAPHALYAVYKTLLDRPDTDFLYSDHDEVGEKGHRKKPFFKPDWSPEMLLSVNYLFPFGVCRAGLWKTLQPFTNSWDFALRLSEHTPRIEHIPQVLYHQYQTALEEQNVASVIGEHLKRVGLPNPVVEKNVRGSISVQWDLKQESLISIVIPSRDLAHLLEKCLASIFTLTTYQHYEVIVVDSGSVDPQTYHLYDRYAQESRFRVVEYTGEFNFSRACNLGAVQARGSLLLFLNNDTEVLSPDWLQLLAQWFERPTTGVVGAKLIYPNQKIQHAGVIIGLSGLADNLFGSCEENTPTIHGRDDWYRDFLAVTGACMMTSRRVFEAVAGFDEEFQLVFSDVEFCVKVHSSGYRVIYTPQVRLIHHESATHRKKIPFMDLKTGTQRLKPWLEQGDPFFNPNLSCSSLLPAIRKNDADTPLKRNAEVMRAYGVNLSLDNQP